ncbi:MAG: transglycosylase domain-containing protein [Treponema sp.]|nr:transglycosylase domain-containing protein [Treponema sp.]
MIKKIMAGIAVFFLIVYAAVRFSPYKDLSNFQSHKISTRIYDANGEILQILALENGVRREWTSLEDIPDSVINSFIREEDKRFYHHHGVDFSAIIRAGKTNVEEGRTVSGASTISMQLARMITPRKKRSLGRKVVEAWNAFRLESRLPKKQILELYLNNVPFGFNTEGVTSAARFFFGKKLNELSENEVGILSKIPRRPQSWANLAGNYEYPYEMPHYINYLKEDSEAGLFEKPEIYLNAALSIQKKCEELLADKINLYSENRLSNGAVFAMDVESGHVLAWVGSSDFFDTEHSGQLDGVLVRNQPGSSMKPFLYALALERGYEPSSVLPDIPMEFGFDSLYVPQNFNNRYNGPVRFRVALASSLNIPAVNILNGLGIADYNNKLFSLGFESLKNQDTGLSLALGGGEVTLYELVRAFSVFPRDGLSLDGIQVFSSDTARLICDILSDSDARALGFGFSKVFQTDFDSMFKTGTANQFQNITALGASGRYVAGVWMGNFSGETIIGKTGSSIPAQIVKEVLQMLEKDGKDHVKFKSPDGYEKIKVCSLSGMKAGKFCDTSVLEYVRKTEIDFCPECNWHRENGIVYPEEYTAWFNLKKRQGSVDYGVLDLKITSPRQGSVFFYDESSEYQNLTVEAVGGKNTMAEMYFDGKYTGSSERPFVFKVPLSRGSHQIDVICENEKDSIFIQVN